MSNNQQPPNHHDQIRQAIVDRQQFYNHQIAMQNHASSQGLQYSYPINNSLDRTSELLRTMQGINTATAATTAMRSTQAPKQPQIDPEFYDKLVNMLGKEGADELVKESVDETYKETANLLQRVVNQKNSDDNISSTKMSEHDKGLQFSPVLAASKKRKADEQPAAVNTKHHKTEVPNPLETSHIDELIAAEAAKRILALTRAEEDFNPPGVDQFRADPAYFDLIMDASKQSTDENDMKSLGSKIVQGVLNINDQSMTVTEPSIQAYILNVICPYFNVPPGVSQIPERIGWQGICQLNLQNIIEFARNVLFQRRKCMKSAVELAIHAFKRENNTTAKDQRIKELERALSKQREEHAEELKHHNANYTNFVAKLIKSHRKEIDAVRKEMNKMQSVHKTFIDSYVESSLDALRNISESEVSNESEGPKSELERDCED